MPASSETLFASLEDALGMLPADRRVLAGVRDGHEWVELSRDELLSDIVQVSRELAAKGLRKGDVISLRTANSAGYGDPFERDPDRVLADVLDEVVSAEAAAQDYGVAIDVARKVVDEARTEQLRAR